MDCVVPTRTVFVQHHAELSSSALLVAALNGARLDAALTPPRSAGKRKGQWLPPWHGELKPGSTYLSKCELPGALPLGGLLPYLTVGVGHNI